MTWRGVGLGLLAGVLLTTPLIAVMYAANHWLDLSFPPFDTFDWVARELPGPLVTFGIDTMIEVLMFAGLSVKDFAKTAEQIMAVGNFLIFGVALTALVYWLVHSRGPNVPLYWGAIVGAVVGLFVAGITASITQSSVHAGIIFLWTLALATAWGIGAVWTSSRLILASATVYESEDGDASVVVYGRRQFLLYMGAGAAAVTVAGVGLGRILATRDEQRLAEQLAAANGAAPGMADMVELPNADDPVKPALGTRPEYTAVRDHYRVFIRSEPTVIDGATWTLPITGLVAAPAMLTLDDLRNNYESRSEFVTLSCISNSVGGDLISTTYWTGVSLQDVLRDVQPTAEAGYLDITCGDGFHETVALDLIDSDPRIMLAYAWDGRPIPFDHGFPLRIWIPDRYGMKQPKWITGIEVISEEREGYWVARGWDAVARVHATSVVDTVAIDGIYHGGDDVRFVPVGGIAYAGARGISKVEVRVDGRGPWHEAQLRSPLSDTTWVIWRYDWPFQAGRHTFRVRTVEADGTPQATAVAPPRPSGATGLHTKQATV
ncbi:MAG: molybdopterin-dependent oxidoreductase [Chloroflexota bacterium]|nr:molybdopterin-dependent oxidoreductase [Chloroflexota bacterium]